MPAGRPSEYGPEILKRAREYEDNWQELFPGSVVPKIEDLAIHLDLNRSTIYDWITHEDKAEFSNIVSRISAKQGSTLIDKGLDGTFNSTITKLILSGKHGYVEKSEQDITSGGEQIQFVNQVPRKTEPASEDGSDT